METPEYYLVSLSSIAIKLTEKNSEWKSVHHITQFKKRVETMEGYELVNQKNQWFLKI